MALDTFVVSYALSTSDWVGDAVYGHVMRAPTNAHGGGVTILEAWVTNAAATNSGTAFSLELQNWGTAGTAAKSTGGTVAAAVGGTASAFTANLAKAFTLSYPYLDAGEYLVLKKGETNSSDPTRAVLSLVCANGI
jgi:hypothetical protein